MPDITSPLQTMPAMPSAAHKEARKVAQEFEGVFAGQVAKIMLESAEPEGDFTGGAGESMFRGILAEQIGNRIAQGRGLGIASMVEAQIITMQGGQGDAP